LRPHDIGRLVAASDPVVSPDGAMVAYVVTRIDLDANRTRSAVWLSPVDGSTPPHQFSAGEHSDTAPAWSPDGRRLAFARKRVGDDDDGPRATLHIAPVTVPGEVVTLAEREEAFAELAWSPDGSRLAFTSRVPPDGDDDNRARPPRRIERFLTRLDDEGWIVDRPQHVFVVALDGSGPPRQATDGPYEDSAPTWSPDGRRLAFVSARHEDWDLGQRNDVFVVEADADAEPRAVTATDSAVWTVSWAPDTDRLALITEDPEVSPSNARLSVVDVATGATVDLATELDRTCAPFPGVRPPVWNGDEVLFSVEDRGRVHVRRVAADGSGPSTVVVGGDRCVNSFHAAGDTLAFVATTAVELPEVFVTAAAGDPADADERRLSGHGLAFAAACPPLAPERFTATCSDGSDEIDAWIVRPEGLGADSPSRHPMLLSVHGGPHTQYGERWFDEVQLWASAGYVVVYANPRGSSGREESWGRAIRAPMAAEHPGSGWGGVDVDDLLAVVDAALEREPGIDPERIGVLGGSYGGFMASWLIGHTDRFRSACSERAVNNLATLETASDVAGRFQFIFGVGHLDQPDFYRERSPVTYVRDISTPVLILHSEQDLRCPVEQADQLFVALRLLGKEFEYHRFPAEGHELSRSGSPRHRVQRAELILDWFGRTL